MQMIPMAIQTPDAAAGQAPKADASAQNSAGNGAGFPELLSQTASQSPAKPALQAPQSNGAPLKPNGFFSDGAFGTAEFAALWGDLSQLALDAQNAFQSANSLSGQVGVMERFVADFQARLNQYQPMAGGLIDDLAGQLGIDLSQLHIPQSEVGGAVFAEPMQVFDKAMEMLQAFIPLLDQPEVTVPTAQPASQSGSGASASAALAAVATPSDAQKQVTPPAVQGAQLAATNTAGPDMPIAQPAPTIAGESGAQRPANPESLALGQTEDGRPAIVTDAPKAALANVVMAAEGGKPSGPAVAVLQNAVPNAPQAPVADAGPSLVTDLPTANTARTSADLAPAFSFARNVAAQVRGTTFEEGKTRVELTPRGLGDIEVEVARDDSGKLRVVLRAENAAVLTAFRNDREMILGMLRDGGVGVDDGEVAFESFGGHGSYHDRSQPHEIEAVAAAPMVTEDDLTGAAIARRADVKPSGALDITT